MSDFATYKALPADQRDELGFARWQERHQINSCGPGCYTQGRQHYRCAIEEIERLTRKLTAEGGK